ASVAGLLKLREFFVGFIYKTEDELFWKKEKGRQVDELIKQCLGLRIEVAASQASTVADQSIRLSLEAVNRSGMYSVPNQLERGKAENDPAMTVSCSLAFNIPGGSAVKDFQVIIPVQYKHTDPVLGELYQP
nr:hypothetical protein [Tanacetum cinerariifolium]